MSDNPKPIYLDYAAATPMDEEVLAAMKPYFSDIFYNPSASYSASGHAKLALETARASVAGTLGAKSSEITFTAGGSEANNLAIHGIMSQYPDSNLIISAIEHESIIKPAGSYSFKYLGVNDKGGVNTRELEKLIDDQTVLVSIMYASNEIGTVEPISDIARLIAKINAKRRATGLNLPLYLHTDACQAANYLDLHTSRLKVDLMTLNSGKIYGPKQTGVLYLKAGIKLTPLISGGGQEHGLRSGTENVAAAVGMAKALEKAQSFRKTETKRLEDLRDYFAIELISIRPDVVFNGSPKTKIANNIHFTVPGIDNERLLMKLDELGIMMAAGSACSASSEEPSHVLKAIGLSDEQAQSSVRLTTGRQTTKDELDTVLKVLKDLI